MGSCQANSSLFMGKRPSFNHPVKSDNSVSLSLAAAIIFLLHLLPFSTVAKVTARITAVVMFAPLFPH